MIHLDFTSWALDFAKAWSKPNRGSICPSVVDQMLSAICEGSRTEAMSSLWDHLTEESHYINNMIANGTLGIQPLCFADTADD